MSPVRKEKPAELVVEVVRRDADDATREQALVKLLADLVRARRARQK